MKKYVFAAFAITALVALLAGYADSTAHDAEPAVPAAVASMDQVLSSPADTERNAGYCLIDCGRCYSDSDCPIRCTAIPLCRANTPVANTSEGLPGVTDAADSAYEDGEARVCEETA